ACLAGLSNIAAAQQPAAKRPAAKRPAAKRPAARQTISLIDTEQEQGGWGFGNGAEFPGAKGELKLVQERFRDKPILALRGDFSKGGNYVQGAIDLPDVPVDVLSFWLNAPNGSDTITIRVVDGSDQCHQLKLKVNDKGGWQRISLPVDEFFRKMGTAGALNITSQYEKWGGANDGRWHQPGKLLVVLCSRDLGTTPEVLFSDVVLQPSRPKTSIKKTIQLSEMLDLGELDWEFNLGAEYPGAEGGLDVVRDQPESGKNSMHLHADFTGGGQYVGIRKSFAPLAVKAMNVIRIKMRSDSITQFALRMVDGGGQTHQRKTIPFTPDGKWHDVEIVPAKIAGGEHWGGPNDGKWRDSVQLVELMLNVRSSEAKKPDLFIANIRADVVVEATELPATSTHGFESLAEFQDNWQASGVVKLAGKGASGTKNSLLLERTLATLQQHTSCSNKLFAVSPGTWQVNYSWKSDLYSPDNSYHGSVALELFDRAGKLLESVPVGIGFGKCDWKKVSRTLSLPTGCATARFRFQLNKTYGSFQVDELTASRLKLQPIERRVERIRIASDSLGNLFLPGEEIVFQATIEANKPLPLGGQSVRYSVRDYWGAGLIPSGNFTLVRQAPKGGRFIYTADVALPASAIEIGKYHELHIEVPQDAGDPVAEYSGFAVLPPAPSKQYPAEDVPFTIRNWDSRIPAYFRLSDRLGLRMMGVWGGWTPQSPYKPSCPGIDLCEELNAKWITGTPASQIERNGFENYSEESLRKGMRNFLESYADKGLAMIAMGNEPHGTGEKVLENVRAYRAIYETVKSFDPKVHVMGTSVEPNEEYFRAGYQKYLDSYDFHIYEDYANVRRTMKEYRGLMEKYNAVKPLHSTELGLNSQGQTRLAVSREMIKKFVSFFAEGGATVSWFTIQYPDPQGKARGEFGDSHCMFDCKYNLYNPRLDAITHYQLINAICVKKFVEERRYAGDAHAYLFRDEQGHCLQALWLDGRRQDVFVPLATEDEVRLIRIDGTTQILHCEDGGVTVSLSDDPLLLMYDDSRAKDKNATLAESLGTPALALSMPTGSVAAGEAVTLLLTGKHANAETLKILCPPAWLASVKPVAPLADSKTQVAVTLIAPSVTSARAVQIRIQAVVKGQAVAELHVPITVASE
ncbi:MAG: hypothetical protein ACI9G1_000774, partial [Pirellulaceae bacterium]